VWQASCQIFDELLLSAAEAGLQQIEAAEFADIFHDGSSEGGISQLR